MKFFLAGVMQGANVQPEMHAQDYRGQLQALLEETFDEADIYDPWGQHQESFGYDDTKGREVFLQHNQMCGEVDAVIAFIPHASMGTAIEIWEAHRNGRTVITISPFTTHWAIKFCSDKIYPDMETFEEGLRSGEVKRVLEEKQR